MPPAPVRPVRIPRPISNCWPKTGRCRYLLGGTQLDRPRQHLLGGGLAEFRQRSGFDLADAFLAHAHDVAHLLQGLRLVAAAEAEAADDNLPLAIVEPPQDAVQRDLAAELGSLQLMVVGGNLGGGREKLERIGTKTIVIAQASGMLRAKLLMIAQVA